MPEGGGEMGLEEARCERVAHPYNNGIVYLHCS